MQQLESGGTPINLDGITGAFVENGKPKWGTILTTAGTALIGAIGGIFFGESTLAIIIGALIGAIGGFFGSSVLQGQGPDSSATAAPGTPARRGAHNSTVPAPVVEAGVGYAAHKAAERLKPKAIPAVDPNAAVTETASMSGTTANLNYSNESISVGTNVNNGKIPGVQPKPVVQDSTATFVADTNGNQAIKSQTAPAVATPSVKAALESQSVTTNGSVSTPKSQPTQTISPASPTVSQNGTTFTADTITTQIPSETSVTVTAEGQAAATEQTAAFKAGQKYAQIKNTVSELPGQTKSMAMKAGAAVREAGKKTVAVGPSVAASGLGAGAFALASVDGAAKFSDSWNKSDGKGQAIAAVQTGAAGYGATIMGANIFGKLASASSRIPVLGAVTGLAGAVYEGHMEDTTEHAQERRLSGETAVAVGLGTGMAAAAALVAAGVATGGIAWGVAAVVGGVAAWGTKATGDSIIEKSRNAEKEIASLKPSADYKNLDSIQHILSGQLDQLGVKKLQEPDIERLKKLGVSINQNNMGEFDFTNSKNVGFLRQAIQTKAAELENAIADNKPSWYSLPRAYRFGSSANTYNTALSEKAICDAALKELDGDGKIEGYAKKVQRLEAHHPTPVVAAPKNLPPLAKPLQQEQTVSK